MATPDGIDNQFDDTAPSVDFTYTQDLVRYDPDIQRRTFTGCDTGMSATLVTVEGGGHTWPDGLIDLPQFGRTTRTVDATDLILDFFAAQ